MIRMSMVVVAVCLALPGAASAQVHDGSDQSASQQRIADDFRAAGSRCAAPACHNEADGVYPPSTRPGEGARTPSISAGRSQPEN